ncbi:MAG TPA: phage major capsid protein [Syntrophales bacterium]|nr:phage major capsid protein [Syntrophales bacterium]HOX94498.1 phage major capsid protein [Syntrophales bacterium]HPI57875.1 phage major capsid protein [Syntrophales bacterium]HPN24533.1 phage major capsid protein [Syntrophales bacterium]HQM28839.1 phage major capsid protein [Syntrophales bacterium]
MKARTETTNPDFKKMSDAELRENRGDILHRMSRILTDSEKAGELSEAEDQKYRDLEKQEKEIFAELDRRDNEPIRRLHQPKTTRSLDPIPRLGQIGLDYRRLFGPSEDRGGYDSFSDFCNAVATGTVERRTNIAGGGVLGGFLVPEFWSAALVNLIAAQSVTAKYVRTVPVTGDTNFPLWNSFDRTTGEVGNIEATWTAEATASTEVSPELTSVLLTPKKLIVYASASRELVQDGIDFGTQLGGALVQAIAGGLDKAILVGSGVGQPLGVIDSPSAVSIARATAGAIGYADITAMLSRIWPPLLTNVVWICSPGAFLQILRLKDDANGLIWPISGGNIQGDFAMSILGRPLIVSDRLSALGTKGDLVCADLSQYILAMRQEVTLESTNSARWSEDLISWRACLRADGVSIWKSAITPANGSDSLSWAAILT